MVFFTVFKIVSSYISQSQKTFRVDVRFVLYASIVSIPYTHFIIILHEVYKKGHNSIYFNE